MWMCLTGLPSRLPLRPVRKRSASFSPSSTTPASTVHSISWKRPKTIGTKSSKVNALGVLIGPQEVAKALIAAGTKGKIVNTASIAGRSGDAEWAPYCASKAAVISLTQAGARALAKRGITVNAFAPGVVETEKLWEQLDKDLMDMGIASKPGEAMGNFAKNILLGRTSTPETS